MKSFTYFIALLFFGSIGYSQANLLNSNTIQANLRENADAFVALDEVKINVDSYKSMTIKTRRIVTVFNESGERHINAAEVYSKNSKIKSIEAVIYDKNGKEIKKIKKKDFVDNSMNDGFSILNDNRILYLNYVATNYPYTVEFTSEIQSSNTAFIQGWRPLTNYFVSVGKSYYEVNYPTDIGFRYLENNMDYFPITSSKTNTKLSFTAEKIEALRREDYTPNLAKFLPNVLVAVNKFQLEGVDGFASNWEEFGKWQNSLLEGTDKLPDATISKINAIVGNENDPIKKVKLVQEYVQNKTRYVSVQLGIGGWKPMLASDVDRLGYGDCKALTNYTKALLSAVGIPSYYSVVYLDNQKRSLNQDFTSLQGNHVILAVPIENELKWIECTSQTIPFDFQGDSTDDRLALLIKPEGGELVRTKVYQPKDNAQISKGSYVLETSGGLKGEIIIKSTGFQYGDKYSLERQSESDKKDFYKRYFGNINNLVIKKMTFENDKDAIVFTENIQLESNQYATKNGNRLMVPVNAFNKFSSIPNRYKSRKTPFHIERGFEDTDEIVVTLPKDCEIEAIPENIKLETKFGNYEVSYELKENQLFFKRHLTTSEGSFSKDDYEEFRKFREQIARNDNAKMVLLIK
jgi:transglutaminase-like putative cysteine protease